jgi:hypothetical protein
MTTASSSYIQIKNKLCEATIIISILFAINKIFQNIVYNRVMSAVHASMSVNAENFVTQSHAKTRDIFHLWVDHVYGEEPIRLSDLQDVYGASAFPFNDDVIV